MAAERFLLPKEPFSCNLSIFFHAGQERFAPVSVALKPNANHTCISGCLAVVGD